MANFIAAMPCLVAAHKQETREMSVRLGRVQLRIMQVLWERGRATAREITDSLNAQSPIAHSTVQTLLRSLADKAAVAHEVDGRTFVFFPLVREEQVTRSVTRDLLDRVFDGSVSNLVSYLLQHEKVSPEEIKELRRLINKQARK
ncbi:MAG TPA: BlaI/MecI/CopY family transcriptional regulator [Pirellulales bacterium]|nr:BlaI/MecI/CopY family transcriptional regulator [Pirellulales bacterium]